MVLKIGPQKRSPLTGVEADRDDDDQRCEGCGAPGAAFWMGDLAAAWASLRKRGCAGPPPTMASAKAMAQASPSQYCLECAIALEADGWIVCPDKEGAE